MQSFDAREGPRTAIRSLRDFKSLSTDDTVLFIHGGPPLTHPLVGDVIGFALGWEGQEHGVLWISGDTVLYDGVREVADRLAVDTALVHLGGVRFPGTGPLRYTMTAAEAVELWSLVRPPAAIPIDYEGWKHFKQSRAAIEQEFAGAPDEVQGSIRWLSTSEPAAV